MTQKNMGLCFGAFSSPVVCYPCRLKGVLLARMENAAKPPETALLLSWHFFCYFSMLLCSTKKRTQLNTDVNSNLRSASFSLQEMLLLYD